MNETKASINEYKDTTYDRDPDCPACLRNLPHTPDEHRAALGRNYYASLPDYQSDTDSMW